MSAPLVSALMVTRNRLRLVRRSLACLAAQTWPKLELVVVDHGTEDYSPLLAEYRGRMEIRYDRIAHEPSVKLGGLRNLLLERARGEYLAVWDDDDWFHPERLATQVAYLRETALEAVELRYCLVHLNEPGFVERPFRADSRDGFPGTLVFHPTDLRYPNIQRSEDLAFETAFRKRGRFGCIEAGSSHLMVRCYHGANTWDRAHTERRLRRHLRDKIDYAWARWVRRDPWSQRAFRLDEAEAATARHFLDESRALGLLHQASPSER